MRLMSFWTYTDDAAAPPPVTDVGSGTGTGARRRTRTASGLRYYRQRGFICIPQVPDGIRTTIGAFVTSVVSSIVGKK
jgi:hypothetical protein